MAAARAGAAWAPISARRVSISARRRPSAPSRLGEQRRAFGVGGEHHVDEPLGAARRLLRHRADARRARQADGAALGRDLALDDAEQGGLAGAVAADHADPRSRRHGEGGSVEDHAIADPVGQIVDVQHGGLVAFRRP